MSVTITKSDIIRIDDTAVRLKWTSDATLPITFRVWQNGVRIANFVSPTAGAFIDLHVPIGESHAVEVFDKACSVPKPAFPGRFTLHWTAIAGATSYRIEELVSAVWTLRATQSDDGRQAWTFLSRWLEDVTTHGFRIIAVDAAGNLGTALTFSVEMVRTPDLPEVSYVWSAGTGRITVAAA